MTPDLRLVSHNGHVVPRLQIANANEVKIETFGIAICGPDIFITRNKVNCTLADLLNAIADVALRKAGQIDAALAELNSGQICADPPPITGGA